MKTNIFPAIRLTLVCLVFFSGVYTLMIWGAAQLAPNNGEGELLNANEKTCYANVGQKFTQDNYFWSRPSAVDYNAAGAGGSNKGPSNPAYLNDVQARIDTFLVHNPGVSRAEIPSDLVTASGSGLDPHISRQAAVIQVKRIARVRGIAEGNIQQLILSNTEKPLLGLFGTERINVLRLNIALDNLK
ncbi:K(+)-transporting ATPase subunit C [Mucilaginibacter segetis]|uniref:Potassium-transporting ATPase KdpC subunit n=1 Tax=Mucilaginibacter segetis TaxID=2793071 RepID=A0A934PU72_9SPHI|nr:K(+)-transporting ATPase subunit C [Mucilaginibacter segetis]MBK0379622.1 K(+)-transporting ATPase subunit C [Mucilaginibacter segetis]